MEQKTSFIRNRKLWLWVAALLFVFAVLLLVVAPPAIRLGLEKWLEAQGPISAEIDGVEFRLFSGTVVIHTIVAEREEAPGRIVADRASLSLQLWPLWRKRLMLDEISLSNASVTVRQQAGVWFIGGLKYDPGRKKKESSWQLGLEAIDLQNVRVKLLGAPEEKTITVVSAHIDSLQAWRPDASSRFDLQLQAAGGTAAVSGEATPFAEQPALDGRLTVSGFSLPWLQQWLPDEVSVQSGTLDLDSTVTGRYRPDEKRLHVVLDSGIKADQLQGTFAGNQLEGALTWKGQVEASAPRENQPPLLLADGTLGAAELALQPARQPLRLALAEGSLEIVFRMGDAQVPAGARFLLRSTGKIAGLQVADIDSGLALARIASLQVREARLAGQQTFSAAAITLAGMQGLETPPANGEEAAPLLSLKELQASAIEVAVGQRVGIGELHLRGLQAQLTLGSAGNIDLGPWLPYFQPEEKTAKPQPAASPLSFRLGLVDIGGDSRVTLVDARLDPPVRFVLSPLQAQIKNLDSGTGQGPAIFTAEMQVNGQPLSLQGKGELWAAQPSVDGHLKIQSFSLQTLTPYLQNAPLRLQQGQLFLDTDLQLRYAQEAKSLQVGLDGSLRVENLGGATADLAIDEGRLSWRGQLQFSSESGGGKPGLTARGQLTGGPLRLRLPAEKLAIRLEEIQVTEEFAMGTAAVPKNAPYLLQADGSLQRLRVEAQDKKLTLLALDSLRLQGARAAGANEVAIQQLQTGAIRALQRPAQEKTEPQAADYLFTAAQLKMEAMRLDNRRELKLQSVQVAQPAMVLVRKEQGFTFQGWMAAAQQEAKPAAKKPPLQYTIGSVELTGGRLAFFDRSVAPAVSLEVNPFNLRAQGVDNGARGQSAIALEGRFSQFSTLRLNGTVQSFSETPTADLQLVLEGFTLPKITAYPEKFIGYKIESGNLDLRADLNIRQGQLDSTAKVDLVKLELVPVGEERADITEQLGFPLGAGLAMLRDKGGTISLNFPITGDLKNPHIGIAGVVQKAFFRAVRSAAISYFSPLGAAALIGKRLILDRALALRFQPAYFPPGSAQLPPETADYLQKTAEKLNGRPKVNVVLCGVAIPEDWSAAEPAAAPAPSAAGSAVPELLDLATERATAVREFLVGQGVDAGRLVSCSPEVDRSADARARVEIGI